MAAPYAIAKQSGGSAVIWGSIYDNKKARLKSAGFACGQKQDEKDQPKFFPTKSQLTRFQNASTNFGRALR